MASTNNVELEEGVPAADADHVPRVSVFTPSHKPQYLDQCLASLLAQTFTDWEWVVVLNGKARWWDTSKDPRVRVMKRAELQGVGAAKRYACAQARGEILVEFDHDDELSPDALAEVVSAFDEHPDIGFVYSQCAQIKTDGSRDDRRFDERNGWEYQEVDVNGRIVMQCDSMAASPHNVSYIWFAPNHIRAFRRSSYEAIGGYDETRDILDDQDLMCRLYQLTDFHLIEKCLYLQRVHPENTQAVPELNVRIQQETVTLYDRYVQPNALAWAGRRGLMALDLGAAHNKQPGYLGVDQYDQPGVDIVGDVTKGIDLPDSSVGVIRAVDFLEHIPDKIAMFNELYRLLAHGGMLLSLTPSTDGRGAWQDPTHVAFYNENSFWYFTNSEYARFVPDIKCRFQSSRVVTFFPNEWHQQNNIPYVCANLIAIKEGPRQGGFLLI
jgi:glycosyltransferase involved in cell wall biosynthesis